MSPSAPATDSLKTVIDFSQSLSQWSVLLIGGSAAAMLGSSNWRPGRLLVRISYLVLIPAAIVLLFTSIHYGVAAQQNCLALMLLPKPDVSGATTELNDHLLSQLTYMQRGLYCLGVWFLVFLFWWVFDKKIDLEKKGKR